MKLYFNYHKQLIRVDNIKEFHPLLFDSQITNFFLLQKFLISRGELAKPVPFRHLVSKEVFELLLLKLHQKIGFNDRMMRLYEWKEIKIRTGLDKEACIIIELENSTLNEVK